jgi:hypothetical protein
MRASRTGKPKAIRINQEIRGRPVAAILHWSIEEEHSGDLCIAGPSEAVKDLKRS